MVVVAFELDLDKLIKGGGTIRLHGREIRNRTPRESIKNGFALLTEVKFGSRVDLYLPLDCDIKVALHDKTIGDLTEIARLK